MYHLGLTVLWKYVACMLLALVLGIGQMWAQESVVAYGFENNSMNETGYTQSSGDGNRSISSTVSRTGDYSLEQNNNNTSAKNCKVTVPIPSNKNKYVHVIAYLKKSSSASGNIELKYYSEYQGGDLGKVSPSSNLSTEWTRISTKGNKNNSTTYTSLELRINTQTATKGDKYYVDDVVMYTTTGDAKTDLKKPGSATITAHATDALTWASGTDASDDNNGATGVQKTLIFKKTTGTADGLTLNDQGVYSLTAKEGRSTDQSGNWTLVAVVDPTTESYTTGLTAGHHYAIVHRDLAYNYSDPVYTTIASSCPATIPGDISKGALKDGEIILTAAGYESKPATDEWYWQSAADGTDRTGTSGAEKTVNAAGTYYIRSYNEEDCWSAAKSIEVTAEDFVVKYAVTKGTHVNGDFTISPTSQGAGEEVELEATPDDGYLLDFWSITKTEDGSATGITVTNDKFTMPAYAVTVNATFSLAPTYTVTLNPAGGTIVDATGWTLNAGNYEKEVAEGTVLTLPTFTKTNRAFKTWRKAGPADVASSVTVDGDLTLTAVWTATVEQVIYSWESPDGTAVEVGGTAITKDQDGNTVEGNDNVNATLTNVTVAYKAIMLNGKISSNAWSGNYVQITTDEAVKTGDKVKITACTTKGDASKKGSAQMRAGTSATSTAIFTDGNSYNDIYAEGALSPNTKTFTVPDGVNTSTLTMTRSQSSTNCWVTKLQIIREVQVEEGDLLTVTFTSNGGSAIAAVQLASGQAVAKPADPTYAHHRFNEWQLGGVAYDFDDPVTEDITLVADWTQLYTVTYAKGDESATGDAPTQVDKAAGETFKVDKNPFTVAGKDFDKWNDGTNDYNPDDTYTVGTEDVVLTAQWKTASAKYTVIFKDGDTELGTKLFEVGSVPSDADIDKTKALSTFAAWQKEGEDIALDDASWTTVEKDAEVTLTARWTKAYAQSIDMEQFVIDNTKAGNWHAYLDSKGYAYASSNMSLDSLDGGKTKNNYQYLGLKFNKNSENTYVEGNLQAEKLMIVKVGAVGGSTYMKIDGDKVVEPAIVGGVEADSAAAYTYWYYDTDKTFSLFHENGGTSMLKGITITDPYEVTFDANGGDPVSAQFGKPSVTLPLPVKGTESFLGWFDGETKVGMNEDKYTPTDNITLVAHWETVSTDNTLSDLKVGGVTVDGFSPTVHTYYVVLPYGTAVGDIPAISATANSIKAKQVAIQQAVWTDEPYNCYRAQANVQAEDESWGYYDVRFSFAPKDGVEIIKATHTGAKAANVTGAIGGTYEKSTQDGGKLGSNDHYFGIKLAEGTFQAGDVVKIHATNTSELVQIFSDKGETAIDDDGAFNGEDYTFTLTAATEWIYLYRTSTAGSKMNPTLGYMAVYRPMDPVLTAITINGVACEKGEGNTFAVTLPNGTDLSKMTVTPTIVWNGAGTAAPTVGWDWGTNTYRVTDKDGDYIDYTITLTEAAAPSAAPTITTQPEGANYIEGATIAALKVVATGSGDLSYQWQVKDGEEYENIEDATDASYTPTVTAIGSYVYRCVVTNTEAGHPATSLASSDATITIAEDPAAIKLLDGSTVNHTNFITGVTANETVEFQGNTVNYAKFSGTVSNVNGVKDLTRVIAYNATTNKTKIRIYAHNNSTNARSILVKGLVEGADAATDLATIDLDNKEDKVSDWIEFNNAANRTIYIFVGSSAGDVYFTQVKVIESGETPMKQVGEAGYSLNFNKGRFFGTASTDLAFEGLNAKLSGDYTALNSGYAKLNATSMSFTVANPVLLKVTTNNNKTYYVTKGAAGTDNETAKAGESEFDLTKGEWYITAGAAEVQFTKIEFVAPKCNLAISTQPKSNTNFGAGDMMATVVAASSTDGASLAYQWYDADDNEVAGATEATLTTTVEGTYYVIVTASKSGYQDKAVQSNTIELGRRDLTIATLSALSYGDPATAIALEADKYEYRVILDEGTTDVPALHATATMDTYADVVITDAATFTGYNAQSTVHVTAEDGVTELTYTVNFIVKHIYTALEDVTESTTWNWKGSVDQIINDVPNKGVIIANYIEGDNFEMIEGKADEYARRNQNDGVYQGTYLHFNTTVAGKVKIYFRAPSSGENCTITIKNNGNEIVAGTRGNTFGWSKEIFVKGDVVIEMENDKQGGGTTRVQQIVFSTTPDYTRAEMLGNGVYGTICLPNNVPAGAAFGATFYELMGRENTYGKLVFDEITNGALEAGVPYLFQAHGDKMILFYGEDVEPAPVDKGNGMYGTFEQVVLSGADLEGVYYFAQKALWSCDGAIDLTIPANRAYVKLSEIDYLPANDQPAPGRRRVTMAVNGEKVATGVENVQGDDVQSTKVLIDGNLYILRGEKMFDVTGRLVK